MRRRAAIKVRHGFAMVGMLGVGVAAVAGVLDRLWPGGPVSARAVVVRVIVAYTFVMVCIRVLGKRELSSLSPLDLVTLLLIPEILSEAMVGEGSLRNALSGVAALLGVVSLISLLLHRFPQLSERISRQPTVLVARGVLNENAMNCERIEPEELLAEMHKNGIERLSEVRWAILENDGNLTIVREDKGEQPGAGTDRRQL